MLIPHRPSSLTILCEQHLATWKRNLCFLLIILGSAFLQTEGALFSRSCSLSVHIAPSLPYPFPHPHPNLHRAVKSCLVKSCSAQQKCHGGEMEASKGMEAWPKERNHYSPFPSNRLRDVWEGGAKAILAQWNKSLPFYRLFHGSPGPGK